MGGFFIMDSQSVKVEAAEKKSEYTHADRIFSLLLLPLCYLLVRSFSGVGLTELWGDDISVGLGAFVSTVLTVVWCVAYLKIKGVSLGVSDILFAVFCTVLSSGFFFFANPFTGWLCAKLLTVSCIYMLYACCTVPGRVNDIMPLEMCRAVFFSPLSDIGAFFGSMVGNAKKAAKACVYAVGGFLLALIPTVIAVSLLSGTSNEFKKIVNEIFTAEAVFTQAKYIILAILLAVYLFACAHAPLVNKRENKAEEDEKALDRLRVLPTVTGLSMLVPMSVMYVLYFCVQGSELFCGFTGVIPENMTASSFARSGFFQLCAVAALNLAVLATVAAFTKNNGKNTVYRVFSAVFSVMTLVLISSAMSKLILYIDHYGLTRLRIYAGWFMLLLTAVFILLTVKQIFTRMKLFGALSIAVCVSVFAVTFINVDKLIPDYNAEAYLSGAIYSIDSDQFIECGVCSYDALDKLANADKYISDVFSKEKAETAKNLSANARSEIERRYGRVKKDIFTVTVYDDISSIYADEDTEQDTEHVEYKEYYHLIIGENNIKSIDYLFPDIHQGGLMEKADGSLYRKGEVIDLGDADIIGDLRGLQIIAYGKYGGIVWETVIPDSEENKGVSYFKDGDWEIKLTFFTAGENKVSGQ